MSLSIDALLLLVFCNVLWSGAYSVSKNLMTEFLPMEIAFIRYSFATLPLFLIWVGRQFLGKKKFTFYRTDLRLVLVGVLTFFISPLFQVTGINLSRAIDSSLMVAIEPLMTIIAATIMLGERPTRRLSVSVVLAIAGVAIVTEITMVKLLSFKDGRLIGNLLMLGSLASETVYSTLVKPALGKRTPFEILAIALISGALLLGIYQLMFSDFSRLGGYKILFASTNLRHWASFLFLSWGSGKVGSRMVRLAPCSGRCRSVL